MPGVLHIVIQQINPDQSTFAAKVFECLCSTAKEVADSDGLEIERDFTEDFIFGLLKAAVTPELVKVVIETSASEPDLAKGTAKLKALMTPVCRQCIEDAVRLTKAERQHIQA